MSGDTYNGWANRETWLVSVWGYIDTLVEMAKESGDVVTPEWCVMWFSDLTATEESKVDGILSDMLGGALNHIDWREISKAVNDELTR